MVYRINFTDKSKGSFEIEDGAVNSSDTSLILPGKNKSDYGQIMIENLVHMLENFANINPPKNALEGQLWYDTTVGVDQLKIYDGSGNWVSAGNVKKSIIRPDANSSRVGDLWVDTANQQLYLFNGVRWILIGPDFSRSTDTGISFDSINDNSVPPSSKNVARLIIRGKVILIISDEEFTPQELISGFDKIRAGVNISSELKYYGVIETAESLTLPNGEKIPAASVARKDLDNTFLKPIRIQSNGGIVIGETPTLRTSVQGFNSIFRNLTTGGNIQFNLTVDSRLDTNRIISAMVIGTEGIQLGRPVTVNGNIQIVSTDLNQGKLLVESTQEDSIKTLGGLVIGDSLSSDQTAINVLNGKTSLLALETNSILPGDNSSYIGSQTNKFQRIYVNEIVADKFTGFSSSESENSTIFQGSLLGNASSSNHWQESITFTSSDESEIDFEDIVFGNKDNFENQTIEFSVNSKFVENKPLVTDIFPDDELVIVRNSQIRKIKQDLLVSTVPRFPIGTIIQYAGIIPPYNHREGYWLFCDGSLVPITKYRSLYDEIRNYFKGLAEFDDTKFFRLPDMRGRFPLGRSNMENINYEDTDPGSIVDNMLEPEAIILGARSGSPTRTLVTSNIPDHEHTLKGDSDTDFYAISRRANAPDSNVDGAPEARNLAGDLAGSSIPQTGRIIENGIVRPVDQSPVPVPIVNPYQTVNYIIYAGNILGGDI